MEHSYFDQLPSRFQHFYSLKALSYLKMCNFLTLSCFDYLKRFIVFPPLLSFYSTTSSIVGVLEFTIEFIRCLAIIFFLSFYLVDHRIHGESAWKIQYVARLSFDSMLTNTAIYCCDWQWPWSRINNSIIRYQWLITQYSWLLIWQFRTQFSIAGISRSINLRILET